MRSANICRNLMGSLIPCRLVIMWIHPYKACHFFQAVDHFLLTDGGKN